MGSKAGQHIGKNVKMGKGVILLPNAYIGDNTEIGDNTIIQYGAYIEHDCKIGANSRVGTNAVLRRETHLGDYSTIGSLAASEGKNWIGNHVLIQTQCHLTTGLTVEDWVFMGPSCVTTNDHKMLHGRRHVEEFTPQAAYIKFGTRVGAGTTINPGCIIGRECVIGSSSLVAIDMPDFSFACGVPARLIATADCAYKLPEERYEKFRNRISEQELTNLMDKILGG